MIHTKVKCPVCGDVIQEGRKDYFCRSYAFGRNCRFCVSRTKNIITQISGQPLNYPEFIKLLQPAGLTVPVRDKRYQFQIVTGKRQEKRTWKVTVRTSGAGEINGRREEVHDEVIKNLELSESGN